MIMVKEKQIGILIKEYYRIVSPLMAYVPCDKTEKTQRQVLNLLCRAKKREAVEEACQAMIDQAKCLQSCTDGALLVSSDMARDCIAFDIKMDILAEGKVSKLRSFDAGIFVEELKAAANRGRKNACKLLAVLNWLGWMIPQNKDTAQRIWASLAMSGDRLAVDMLIFGYNEEGNTAEAEKWSNVRHILDQEQAAFSAIAVHANYPQYTEEEVQIANLITFISLKVSEKGGADLDRAMLHYVLHSEADYGTKMCRLSEETNYFLAMDAEDRFAKKEYGF